MFEVKRKRFVNITMLLRVIGWLLLIESGFMCIPIIADFVVGGGNLAFVWSALITSCTGCSLMALRPKSKEMGRREALLLTALTWVVLSLFGMLPFLFAGTHLSVTDAFFETMSGFTTTGASVLASLENIPVGVLLWRCIVQWIGGLGIILFTLAVIPMLNYSGGIQLFNAEVTGITHDKLRPRVSSTAKSLWLMYIGLSIFAIVLLCFSEMPLWEAICTGLSTVSTGGFATTNMSLGKYDTTYIKIVMMIFMFMGGISFTLIYKVLSGRSVSPLKNTAFRVYGCGVLIAYVLLTLNYVIAREPISLRALTIDPLFQSVSIFSSTGIIQPGYVDSGAISFTVLLLMMFIGACAGSTSGGAKIDRIIVLFKFIKTQFSRVMHPNAVCAVAVNGKGIPTPVVMKTLSFLFLYIIVVIAGGLVLSLIGLPIDESYFCSLSAMSNTGLSTPSMGIDGSYSTAPDAAKWVLTLLMLIGRLEIYTILLLFTRYFWKK